MEIGTETFESGWTPVVAIVVYQGHDDRTGNMRRKAFAMKHPIVDGKRGKCLGGGVQMSRPTFMEIMNSMEGNLSAAYLPANVLASTEPLLVWHRPPAPSKLWFKTKSEALNEMSGKEFAMPSLVFAATCGGGRLGLRVFATKGDSRPTPETTLCRAPFYNVNDRGSVCTGSMEKGTTSVASIETWERGFFESMFTHSNRRRGISCTIGLVEALKQASEGSHWKDEWLVEDDYTLGDLIKGAS